MMRVFFIDTNQPNNLCVILQVQIPIMNSNQDLNRGRTILFTNNCINSLSLVKSGYIQDF